MMKLARTTGRFRKALAVLGLMLAVSAGAFPGEGGKRAPTPPNTWVPTSTKVRPVKQWSSIWYLPATDEFFSWGRPASNRWWNFIRRYDVETLSLAGAQRAWQPSFPKEKQAEWSKDLWPDWARPKGVKNPKWKVIRGPREGSENPGFVMSFVNTDGVVRPNRCPIFHQATWDSKRRKMFFFAGGRTFTYDPVKRAWQDLKTPTPVGCLCLQWHTMCYDPVGDKVVLFGGGAAMTPWGGAKTMVYDFEKNVWERPELKDGVEPELRCNARMVYDPKNKVMVMFGGNTMDARINDTWVLEPAAMAWEERKPKICPPVSDYYAACYVEPAGQVFLCRPVRGTSRTRWSGGDSWAYDVAANIWTPLKIKLPFGKSMSWLSCDYSPKHNRIVLTVPLVGTWSCRPDPASWADTKPERAKGRPGQRSYFYGFVNQLLKPRPADGEKHRKWLDSIPDNRVVDPQYPAKGIPHKTWGSAIIDSDKGVVLYLGGGHSGYKGNEMLHYDIGTSRWSMDSPPCMMPFEWQHGAAIYGWRYRLRPSDQHTYRWYAYDPVSKLVVFCDRNRAHQGQTILLDEDPAKAFKYDRKKHGQMTWVYDPNTRKWFKPVLGRPERIGGFTLALAGTPKGIFAKEGGRLYRIQVVRTRGSDRVDLKWHKQNGGGIGGIPKGYGGEFQPLLYDSRRDRLIYQIGPGDRARDKRPVLLFEWSLETGGPWKRMKTTGYSQTSREIVYDVKNDALLALGERRMFVMDCKTNEWKELVLNMPLPHWKKYGPSSTMVYDPVHNLCAFLIKTNNLVHLFRYNPKTAKYRAAP
jgi:hypothetical protein